MDNGAPSSSLRELTRVLRVQVGQSLARGLREESERATAARRQARLQARRQDGNEEEEDDEEAEDDVAPLTADAKTLNDLTKLVVQYSSVLAADLTAFAKHAKRKTLKVEDVLLCARRSAALRERLEDAADGYQQVLFKTLLSRRLLNVFVCFVLCFLIGFLFF